MTEPSLPTPDPRETDGNRGMRQRLGMLALTAALIAGVGVAVAVGGDNDSGRVDGEGDPESYNEIARELDLAGPNDGLDSIGLPVTVEPDVGLRDKQEVIVRGSGFTPGAQVGMAQCWNDGGPGGQEFCDIAVSAITYADAEGNVVQNLTVRRYINIAAGTVDCATGDLTASCNVGMGNIEDFDESGGARIYFDDELDGEEPPRIDVSPTTGLVDAQELTVTGTGFAPGETVYIVQCMPGEVDPAADCYSREPSGRVDADGQGNITVTVLAERRLGGRGGLDCYLGPHPCVLVAGADRSPNSVQLTYDGSTGAPELFEYTVSPNDGLVDGQTVRVELFGVRGDPANLAILQCADQGQLGETCEHVGDVTIVDGSAGVDIVARRMLTATSEGIDPQGQPIVTTTEADCAQRGRTCYLAILADGPTPVRIPVHFANP